jgi:hypothetical protein
VSAFGADDAAFRQRLIRRMSVCCVLVPSRAYMLAAQQLCCLLAVAVLQLQYHMGRLSKQDTQTMDTVCACRCFEPQPRWLR